MIEKTQLTRGVIQMSGEHGYHILGEDGVSYAVDRTSWHYLERDLGAVHMRHLIGKSVQFVPSQRRNPQGLPYADDTITSLDDSLRARERTYRQIRGIVESMDPHFIFPEERDS